MKKILKAFAFLLVIVYYFGITALNFHNAFIPGINIYLGLISWIIGCGCFIFAFIVCYWFYKFIYKPPEKNITRNRNGANGFKLTRYIPFIKWQRPKKLKVPQHTNVIDMNFPEYISEKDVDRRFYS